MPKTSQDLDDDMEREKPYDASNPQQVNEARKKAGRKKKARLEMIAGIMELKAGRLWMYDLLASCHVGGTPFVQGDPYATHLKIGELNVGNRLLADIGESAPDKYMLMLKEGKRGLE